MSTKYFNDAIIGNGDMLATLNKKGELLRVFYPYKDYRQFIDFFHVGITVNDSNLIYLHEDINNEYKQYYTEDTNILNTEIVNTYFNLKVTQTDWIPVKQNILIRRYQFENQNSINLDVNLVLYSKLLSDSNNQVSGYYKNNTLVQYMHDYMFSIFSKEKASSYQINGTQENLYTGIVHGKDYIGMSSDSSIAYSIGSLKPGESKILEICVNMKENSFKNTMEKIEEEMEIKKNIDYRKEWEDTKRYWLHYVKEHSTLSMKQPQNVYEEKIKQIYHRSILLFPLLINHKTGGISAAAEVDEKKEKCGQYAFCWPRDAIFITKAMDVLDMKKDTQKFYLNFCKNTQSKNGMWEQRFYTDGSLAPSWGYQIDETASVVYGVYQHYESTKEEKFLKESLKMCEKAIEFLLRYLEDIWENKNEFRPSYDLWEENEGIHTYSLATIYAAMEAMLKIYEVVKPSLQENRLKIEKINKQVLILQENIRKLKKYILENMYHTEMKCFVRNKDNKMDISLLGLVTPFHLFTAKDKKVQNTVERLNLTVRTYTGGYLRYEGDRYIGGNPWVIANLWMANYYLEAGEKKKANQCFEFAVNSSTGHGFLPEQVDNKTGKPAWVIGLGWSHALFILTLQKLLEM